MKRALKTTSNFRGLRTACGGLLAAVAQLTFAQEAAEPRDVIRIEVTGSNIPRAEGESALPVQVITREEIERSGSSNVAELMSKVSANLLGFNDQLSIGNQIDENRPGLSSVNLRGIGAGSTLVLINGRRVANYAFDGGSVDVNSIPLSAVDRVEILKDGASAIYGTDAIAGVVNFILRKDFQGVEATGFGTVTQHGGGNQQQAILSAGWGTLAKDRFNVFLTAEYQNDEALRASDRSFSRTGYLPDKGLIDINVQTFPANILAGGRFLNPTLATGCAPPASIPITVQSIHTCGFDVPSIGDIMPAVERTDLLTRATFEVNHNLQLFAEAGYAQNRFLLRFAPTPVAQFSNFDLEPVVYPAGGPFYPAAFAAENGLSGDLDLRYRTVALGPRIDEVTSRALRVVVGADGRFAGWDYSAAVLYSANRQSDDFVSGWISQQRFLAALATGLINPFGPSGPEGDALLASTQVTGKVHDATGATTLVDAKASKELYHLAGGPLAIALGAEARRESLDNTFPPLFTSGDIVGAGGDHQTVTGSRTVQALYAEASVPFARGVEMQLAARYDHYSDFGGTVNPKVAIRWQPVTALLLRTSWGTGFRAPTLPDLFTPFSHTFTGDGRQDPVRCPVTGLAEDCVSNFPVIFGGNPNLQPEKSEQFNAGVAWQALRDWSFSVDYWKINKRNTIGGLPEDSLFQFFDRFSANFVRGPVDPAFPNLPGPIRQIIEWNQNLGNLRTSGIDADVRYQGRTTPFGRFGFNINGTYISQWRQQLDRANYTSGVGNNFIGPIPRWRHSAALNWDSGPWSASVAQTFESGYIEEDLTTCDENFENCGVRRVGTYSVWDVQGIYAGFRNTKIVLGIGNLFDREPPFTQTGSARFAAGYDGVNTDPRGRTFYARVTYAFK
ncbi:MAG: TonB-dependent receptor [Pseudomonadota bacterium]|nr:TonB-dependent receptor [Pseudomonadota bacterium]